MPSHLGPSPVPVSSRRVFFCRISTRHNAIRLEQIANTILKAIGAAQDAARMERVVSFYAGLPRGPAPQTKATGLLGRYQARYFNKNSAARKLKLSISWYTLGTDLE